MAYFICCPGGQDLAAQGRVKLGTLGHREVGSVAFGEQCGDAVVFVDQGSP